MVKYIEGKETQLLSFKEIAEMAAKEGVHLDKVSVGIWAKQNGWQRTRKQINKKVFIGYYRNESQS